MRLFYLYWCLFPSETTICMHPTVINQQWKHIGRGRASDYVFQVCILSGGITRMNSTLFSDWCVWWPLNKWYLLIGNKEHRRSLQLMQHTDNTFVYMTSRTKSYQDIYTRVRVSVSNIFKKIPNSSSPWLFTALLIHSSTTCHITNKAIESSIAFLAVRFLSHTHHFNTGIINSDIRNCRVRNWTGRWFWNCRKYLHHAYRSTRSSCMCEQR